MRAEQFVEAVVCGGGIEFPTDHTAHNLKRRGKEFVRGKANVQTIRADKRLHRRKLLRSDKIDVAIVRHGAVRFRQKVLPFAGKKRLHDAHGVSAARFVLLDRFIDRNLHGRVRKHPTIRGISRIIRKQNDPVHAVGAQRLQVVARAARDSKLPLLERLFPIDITSRGHFGFPPHIVYEPLHTLEHARPHLRIESVGFVRFVIHAPKLSFK